MGKGCGQLSVLLGISDLNVFCFSRKGLYKFIFLLKAAVFLEVSPLFNNILYFYLNTVQRVNLVRIGVLNSQTLLDPVLVFLAVPVASSMAAMWQHYIQHTTRGLCSQNMSYITKL